MNKLNHIAFIMDGNGRWGEKNKSRNFGHLKALNSKKNCRMFCKIKNTYNNILCFFNGKLEKT